MESPNKVEVHAIQQLREKLKDLKLCDEALSTVNLIRFIRARSLNVNAAETMFRNYVKFYDEAHLESVFNYEVPPTVAEEIKQTICGYDYEHCPLSVLKLGRRDTAKLMNLGYKEDYMQYNLQILERYCCMLRIQTKTLKTDYPIQGSTIADMEGLNWKQFASLETLNCLTKQAAILESYYPETGNKYIVINAPRIFTLFWTVIKPFMSERTLEKFQIYGTDRNQWEAVLFKMASKDQIPVHYGGTAPDDIDLLPKPNDCVPKVRGGF